MERIVRLNAVENLCQSGILRMNQHSLHPGKYLAPQKLKISGVNFVLRLFMLLPLLRVSQRHRVVKQSQSLAFNFPWRNASRRKMCGLAPGKAQAYGMLGYHYYPTLGELLGGRGTSSMKVIRNIDLILHKYFKAFGNTSNQKCNTLFIFKVLTGNTGLLSGNLHKLLNKSYNALSDLFLSGTFTFVMIFTRLQTRRIEEIPRLSRNRQLWVVKALKLILPEVVGREKIRTGDKSLYDKSAVVATNLVYQQVDIFNKEDKVQIKLTLRGQWGL